MFNANLILFRNIKVQYYMSCCACNDKVKPKFSHSGGSCYRARKHKLSSTQHDFKNIFSMVWECIFESLGAVTLKQLHGHV